MPFILSLFVNNLDENRDPWISGVKIPGFEGTFTIFAPEPGLWVQLIAVSDVAYYTSLFDFYGDLKTQTRQKIPATELGSKLYRIACRYTLVLLTSYLLHSVQCSGRFNTYQRVWFLRWWCFLYFPLRIGIAAIRLSRSTFVISRSASSWFPMLKMLNCFTSASPSLDVAESVIASTRHLYYSRAFPYMETETSMTQRL